MAIGNILYVKNFISPDLRDKALITLKNLRNGDGGSPTVFANITSLSTNDTKCDVDEASKYHIHKESLGNETKENSGIDTQDSIGNEDKESLGNETEDSCGHSNNEMNNININNNKYINIQSNPISEEDKLFMCYKHRVKRVLGIDEDEIDKMPKHKVIITGIRDQVNADELEERYADSSENIRNIIDVMVEIMMSTRPTIMISGNEYDSYFVKARVFCIFERHMEYMLECIKKNTTKVGNIKAYLRATVFNCTTTLGCYDDLTVQNLIAETYNY